MLLVPLAFALLQAAPAAAPPTWTQEQLEAVSLEIQAQVEALRGLAFKGPVKVRLADKAAFVAYAQARQEQTLTPARRHRDEAVAKLLGLIPPAMDLEATMLELLEHQVGGFYDPGSDTFWLMETFTGGVAKVILAHELTHALDDQHHDIDGTLAGLGGLTDAEFAYAAVVEGSGTSLMNRWVMANAKQISLADLSAAQDLGAEQLAAAPPYLWKPLLAAYLKGANFLTRSKRAEGESVAQAFARPPRSSEQVLHPEKYWKEERRDEPRLIAIETAAVPPGWEVLGEDVLGELFLALLTTPPAQRKGLDATNPLALLALKFSNEAAEGWGGDRLLLLGRGAERALQLVTVWDTPPDAEQFAAALGPDARDVITVLAERGEGFAPGFTPTWARVERGAGAVVLLVGSFAGDDSAKTILEALPLPWRESAPQEQR